MNGARPRFGGRALRFAAAIAVAAPDRLRRAAQAACAAKKCRRGWLAGVDRIQRVYIAPPTLTVGGRPTSHPHSGCLDLNAAVAKQRTYSDQDLRLAASRTILWFFRAGRTPYAAWLGRFGLAHARQAGQAWTEEAHADDTTVDPEAPGAEDLPREIAPHGGVPAEARRVHARLHDDAEEAELGASQGRQDPSHQRLRGHRLHPGRRPQPAGALGGADPRRPRQGSCPACATTSSAACSIRRASPPARSAARSTAPSGRSDRLGRSFPAGAEPWAGKSAHCH